jgi:hypothetical protein
MLPFVFLKPRLPLRNVGRRIVGIRKIRDHVSPGDSVDFHEYVAADVKRPVGRSGLYDHSRIVRMANHEIDQSPERRIIANKINSGWVRPGAVLRPLLLSRRVNIFVAELRKGRLRCGIEA